MIKKLSTLCLMIAFLMTIAFAVTYHVRIVCETEIGDDKGWHYYRTTQEVLVTTITCPTHPAADVRDFTIEKISE